MKRTEKNGAAPGSIDIARYRVHVRRVSTYANATLVVENECRADRPEEKFIDRAMDNAPGFLPIRLSETVRRERVSDIQPTARHRAAIEDGADVRRETIEVMQTRTKHPRAP